MKSEAYLIILFLLLAFTACEQKHFYNDYKTVNNKTWKSTDTLSFLIKTEEEKENLQYAVSVRYSEEYEFSNLWLKIIVNGKSIDTSFRYEIPLFKNDGKPYGKSSGTLSTQTMPLKTTLGLNKKGEYRISIVQLMRKDPLNGISDVGIIIDKH